MTGKKHLWIVSGMIWILLLEIGMLWNKKPELSQISGEIAMSDNMTCYVVDETEQKPVFYEVNKDGEILHFFRDTSEKSGIFFITWTEEGISYLKQENSTEKKELYGIYLMKKKLGKPRCIGKLELKAGSRIAEMGADGADRYIAVMEEDHTRLSLYQWKINGKKRIQPKRTKSLEAAEGAYFTDGTCWKGKIYALTDSGIMVTAEKGEENVKNEETGVTWLEGTRAGIIFENYPDRNLCIKGNAGINRKKGLEQTVQADAMSQKAFWTLQKTSGDSCFLNFTQNSKNTKITELHMGVTDYLSMRKWEVLETASFGFAGWLLLAGAAGILLGKPPLWVKAGIVILGIQFLAVLAAGGSKNTKAWEELALLWGKREIEWLEQNIPGFPEEEVWSQGENLALLRMPVQYQEEVKISSMILYAKDGTGYIISAADKAYGYDFVKLCSQKTLDAIVSAADQGKAEIITAGGSGGYTAAVIPLGDRIAPDIFLVVQAEHPAGAKADQQRYGVFFWILADSILLGAVCMILFHPVKKFADIVTRIAEGTQEKIPVSGSRELEQAWHSVQVLLFQKNRQQYEAEQKIHSCRRFIPEYFPELMEKDNMDQMISGEMKMTTGGFLQIYMGDFKNIPETEYGVQISRLMELFEQERGRYGVLFPDAGSLCSMRMVYENMPEAAVQNAVGVWNWINSTPDMAGKLRPSFLLHCGRCLCGVTGTRCQVIPFAVSKELEWLEGIAEQFWENGVRMAVTEEMRSCLRQEQECRYVGHIRKGEKKYLFYEVLEAYPEEEKQRRSRTKEKFESSLALFYRNDFYLARLGFSEVLKECPKDRLAVWYLFACERMFHADVGTVRCHDLFAEEKS